MSYCSVSCVRWIVRPLKRLDLRNRGPLQLVLVLAAWICPRDSSHRAILRLVMTLFPSMIIALFSLIIKNSLKNLVEDKKLREKHKPMWSAGIALFWDSSHPWHRYGSSWQLYRDIFLFFKISGGWWKVEEKHRCIRLCIRRMGVVRHSQDVIGCYPLDMLL